MGTVTAACVPCAVSMFFSVLLFCSRSAPANCWTRSTWPWKAFFKSSCVLIWDCWSCCLSAGAFCVMFLCSVVLIYCLMLINSTDLVVLRAFICAKFGSAVECSPHVATKGWGVTGIMALWQEKDLMAPFIWKSRLFRLPNASSFSTTSAGHCLSYILICCKKRNMPDTWSAIHWGGGKISSLRQGPASIAYLKEPAHRADLFTTDISRLSTHSKRANQLIRCCDGNIEML